MILGIDATNIKSEGGIVHLFEILNNLNFKRSKVEKIYIWGDSRLLSKVRNNKKIVKYFVNHITNNLIKRLFWQKFILPLELKKIECTLLFVPGGVLFKNKFKSVIMFQNILPFMEDEVSRYNLISKIKFFIQRKIYLSGFNNSNGIIFLSNFSKKLMKKKTFFYKKKIILIPHGISNNFKSKIKKKKSKILKLIYVSKFDIYKNQLELIDAFYNIKKKINTKLTLVGNGDAKIKKKIIDKIFYLNLDKDIKIYDNVNYNNLSKLYNEHDIKIYPSKAETFGLTMLEALRCGLPTLALDSEISREILSESGFYYSNLNDDLLKKLIYVSKNSKLVNNKVNKGKILSNNYSWKKSSNLTFNFIEKIEKIEK